MKRKLLVILSTLIILLVPVMAYADMGAPEIKSFEAIVTKNGGAEYYEYEYVEGDENGYLKKVGDLNFNQKITIVYIGDEYADFYINNEDDDLYSIKLTDFMPLKNQITFTDSEAHKLDEKETVEVLALDGIEMYSGPAKVYKKLGTTIRKGTRIELLYYSESDGWYGVKYNGKEGWISILDASVGYIPEYDLYVNNSKNLVKEIYKNSIVGMIKKGTTISKENYFELDAWSGHSYYYIKDYNGKSGFISKSEEGEEDIYFVLNEKVRTKKSLYLYDTNFPEDEEDYISKIPKDTLLETQYLINNMAYVDYNGKKGWIWVDDVKFIESAAPKTTTTTSSVPSDADVATGDMGDVKKKNNNILIICIASAIVLAITAIVTIILISKKKKKKKLDKKDQKEVVTEEVKDENNN